jgi:hypothetical protein
METAPDWVVAQMPHGYRTRLAEIQRLSAELEGMDRIGWLLWKTGMPLKEAMREVLSSLRYDVELQPETSTYDVRVTIDASRHVLLRLSRTDGVVGKKSPDLVSVFQTLSEQAGDHDRVVLASNNYLMQDAGARAKGEEIASDALDLVQRMGVNFVTTTTLFGIWSISLHDVNRARAQFERLHAQNGGTFVLPPQ